MSNRAAIEQVWQDYLAGQPLCLIETTEVTVKPSDQIDAAFACAEGDGDRSLDDRRVAHRRFFTCTLPAIGRQFDETMPLVCQRFRVVYRPPMATREDTVLP